MGIGPLASVWCSPERDKHSQDHNHRPHQLHTNGCPPFPFLSPSPLAVSLWAVHASLPANRSRERGSEGAVKGQPGQQLLLSSKAAGGASGGFKWLAEGDGMAGCLTRRRIDVEAGGGGGAPSL